MVVKFSVCFTIFISFACSFTDLGNQTLKSENDFRVLGYLFISEEIGKEVDRINWNSYTDVNLAFVQPDQNGDFQTKKEYEYLVEQAHSNGVRVFISIGGGEPPAYLEELMNAENRTHWIKQMVSLVKDYGFDGVDVDLENSLINENYGPFVSELHKSLKEADKLMTAALASWNGNKISDETIGLYDYINIMSYDKTGPWNLEITGQHSPYEMALDDIQYFHESRGVPTSKILLGLPFYGYGFGPGVPSGLWYRQVLDAYPRAYEQDSIVSDEGGIIYYNSPGLIRKKAELAKDFNLAGVMIWHITADTNGSHSLLKAIIDTL